MTITHDAVGNPLNDGTWTYTWEHGRQLASMADSTTTWSFTYDANGLRTSRSNGSTTYSYVYNGSQLVQMKKGNDTLYFIYDATGAPSVVMYNGVPYYYITNLQGDTLLIVDSADNAVVEYWTDAWGNVETISGSMATTLGALNPLIYRGYVYDQETGLYYLQSRYYDPEMGRFINADALASTGADILGNNMFAYCNNNPIMYEDPAGYSLRPTTKCVNDGGYAAIWIVTDGSERSDSLAEYQRNHYPEASGTVYVSIEATDTYSVSYNSQANAAEILVEAAAGLIIASFPHPITAVIAVALEVKTACDLVGYLFPKPYPIVPGDYKQYIVTEQWSVIRKEGNICTRTDYTAVSHYIWWDVRYGLEHWEIVDYSCSYMISTYIEP